MEEFEPIKKIKLGKLFYLKYVYVFIAIIIVFLLGRSYSLTFFKQNYKIAEGSLTTANITIELDNSETNTTSSINATGLNKNKPLEFSKSIVVENTSNFHGSYKVTLERTSGLELTDLKYSVSINGVIKEINDVPSTGLILTSTIMAHETDNIEVRLWPKDTYTGSVTTFVGNLVLERLPLAITGSYYISSQTLTANNNYVYFNCTASTNPETNCEKWRIASVTDNRLVLTTNTYYGNSFTNSNLFNTTLSLNDYSLVTSMSTDNHAVYLKKTVEIINGNGTIDNPYLLSNNDYNSFDEQIIATITYDNDGVTTTQPIYRDRANYISQVINQDGFQGWSTISGGTPEYHLGDTVTFTSNTTLYAVIKNYLSTKIKQLCNDSSVDYVKPYTASLGTTMDTYDGRGTEDVCYYTSDLAGQNGNVLFGGYCWQIIRTTDVGGIKLLYNGKAENNQCLTTRTADVGVVATTVNSQTTLSGDKLYGARFEIFDDNGTNKFRLLNTNTYNWANGDYPNIIGKYVCGTSSAPTGNDSTCEVMYYVGHYQSATQASTEKYTIGTQAHYSQIGTSSYNAGNNSPALVGYMYNATYNNQSKLNWTTNSKVINYDYTPSTVAYFYGDKATWNTSTNMYDLTIDDGSGNDITPPTTTQWQNIRNNAQGMYTCSSSTNTSCATVYYIVANSTDTWMYSISLQNNETYDKTITWTYGTDYIKNGTDYVLTNPDTVTISLKDWYTNYNNAAYKNIYVCSDFTSSTCSTMYYITLTDNYKINFNTSANNYYFGNSVTYQNGSYTIDTNADTTKYQQIWDWYKKYNTTNNSHYTCFNATDNTCGSSVYYIYRTTNDSADYIELKNGKKVEDALKEMLNYKQNTSETDANINVYNSSVKGIIDNFYETKLSSTAKTFIDVSAVFCNDRAVKDLSGWNPTGEMRMLEFTQSNNNKNLTCANVTDRFSTENEYAELAYPIGLLSEPETYLMSSSYAKTGQYYLINSPIAFTSSAYVWNVNSSGVNSSNFATSISGVRPSVSLQPDVEITGSGTYTDPYVIVGSN